MLTFGLELTCRKSRIFGTWRPTDKQIGFCFGFCYGLAQNLKLDEAESLAYIDLVFREIFGRPGTRYVKVIAQQHSHYKMATGEGLKALFDWEETGAPPLVPQGGQEPML